jgi:hypothetical protein
MSLINDALRQAKQTQAQVAPGAAASLELQPVEPSRPATRRSNTLLLVLAGLGLGCILVIGALVVVLASSHQQAKTAALTMRQIDRSSPAATSNLNSFPSATPAIPMTARASTGTGVATNRPKVSVTTPAAVSNTVPAAQSVSAPGAKDAAATNAPLVAQTKAPPKLQSIVFHPTRPSAMIDGKIFFVGDKMGGLKVAAIARDSVTLVGDGQTNVLVLSGN